MADFLPSRSALSGCFPGCLLTSGEAEQQRKSKEIDKCLNREKTYFLGRYGWTFPLCFVQSGCIVPLRAGETGDAEKLLTVPFLVTAGVRVLVDAREKLHIPWGDPANQSNGDKVMAFDTRAVTVVQGMVETSVFLDYLPAIRALWADSGIQHAYDRRREFQLVRFCLSVSQSARL
ncbi:hypothetical protein EK904_013866 [Melospiza melodia maxima]|nr:hypothetical protein EK904_013866 [Melospiza melodia maxima]